MPGDVQLPKHNAVAADGNAERKILAVWGFGERLPLCGTVKNKTVSIEGAF